MRHARCRPPVRDRGRCGVTGWVVFFACVAGAAVSVAAWLAGYAEGMADAVEPMVEWYRRHMGEGDGDDTD